MGKSKVGNQLRRKVIALATAVLFMWSNVTEAAPSLFFNADLASPIESRIPSLVSLIELTPDIGTVQKRHVTDGPTIIHVHDAHTSYEAQINIKKIIKTIVEKYGIQTIFLEGAHGEVKARQFQFFEDYRLSMETAKELARESVLGGAELYLLESSAYQKKNKTQIYGVENYELYRKNLEDYRRVIEYKSVGLDYLNELKEKITTQASKAFNPKLKKFFKQWAFSLDRQGYWFRQVSTLKEYLLDELQIDLTHESQQKNWPMLVRLFNVQKLEKQIDFEKAEQEKAALIDWLKDQSADQKAVEFISGIKPDSEFNDGERPRLFFEQLMDKYREDGLSFLQYQEFSKLAGMVVLRDEIKAVQLMKEVESATTKLLSHLAHTEIEREILSIYKGYQLLKKVFLLELTPEDYAEVIDQLADVNPKAINLRMDDVVGEIVDVDVNLKTENQPSVMQLFKKALEFYDGATLRDRFMLKNMMRLMKERKDYRAVLITGGFHSGGLSSAFEDAGISYANVVPHISSIEKNEAYQKAMTYDLNYLQLKSYVKGFGPANKLANLALDDRRANSLAIQILQAAQVAFRKLISTHPLAWMKALQTRSLEQRMSAFVQRFGSSVEHRLGLDVLPNGLVVLTRGSHYVLLPTGPQQFYGISPNGTPMGLKRSEVRIPDLADADGATLDDFFTGGFSVESVADSDSSATTAATASSSVSGEPLPVTISDGVDGQEFTVAVSQALSPVTIGEGVSGEELTTAVAQAFSPQPNASAVTVDLGQIGTVTVQDFDRPSLVETSEGARVQVVPEPIETEPGSVRLSMRVFLGSSTAVPQPEQMSAYERWEWTRSRTDRKKSPDRDGADAHQRHRVFEQMLTERPDLPGEKTSRSWWRTKRGKPTRRHKPATVREVQPGQKLEDRALMAGVTDFPNDPPLGFFNYGGAAFMEQWNDQPQSPSQFRIDVNVSGAGNGQGAVINYGFVGHGSQDLSNIDSFNFRARSNLTTTTGTVMQIEFKDRDNNVVRIPVNLSNQYQDIRIPRTELVRINPGLRLKQIKEIVFVTTNEMLGHGNKVGYIDVQTSGLDFLPRVAASTYDPSAHTNLSRNIQQKPTLHTSRGSVDGNPFPQTNINLRQDSSKNFAFDYYVAGTNDFVIAQVSYFGRQPGQLGSNFTFAANGPAGERMKVEIHDTNGNVVKPADFVVTLDGTKKNYSFNLSGNNVPAGFNPNSIAFINFVVDRQGAVTSKTIDIEVDGLDFIKTTTPQPYNRDELSTLPGAPTSNAFTGSVSGQPNAGTSFQLSETSLGLQGLFSIGHQNDFIVGEINFNEQGENLGSEVTFATFGTRGRTLRVDVVDVNGKKARFKVPLQASMHNHTLNLQSGGHIDPGFQRSKIRRIELIGDQQTMGSSGRVSFFINGLSHMVRGQGSTVGNPGIAQPPSTPVASPTPTAPSAPVAGGLPLQPTITTQAQVNPTVSTGVRAPSAGALPLNPPLTSASVAPQTAAVQSATDPLVPYSIPGVTVLPNKPPLGFFNFGGAPFMNQWHQQPQSPAEFRIDVDVTALGSGQGAVINYGLTERGYQGFRNYNQIVFRGRTNLRCSQDCMSIEFKDTNGEVARIGVRGLTTQFQDMRVTQQALLAANPNINIARIKEIVFVTLQVMPHQQRGYIDIQTGGLEYIPEVRPSGYNASRHNNLSLGRAQGGPTVTANRYSTTGSPSGGTTVSLVQQSDRRFYFDYNIGNDNDFVIAQIPFGYFNAQGNFIGEAGRLGEVFEFAAKGPSSKRLKVVIRDTNGNVARVADYKPVLNGQLRNYRFELVGGNVDPGFNPNSIASIDFVADRNGSRSGRIEIEVAGLDYIRSAPASAYNQSALSTLPGNPRVVSNVRSVSGQPSPQSSINQTQTASKISTSYTIGSANEFFLTEINYGYFDSQGRFQGGEPQNLGSSLTVAAFGSAGNRLKVEVVDEFGRKGRFWLPLTGAKRNYQLNLVGGANLEPGFNSSRIAAIRLVGDQNEMGAAGAFEFEVHGLHHIPTAQSLAYNQSNLTRLPNSPVVVANKGSSLNNGQPVAGTQMTQTQTSPRDFEVDFTIGRDEDFTFSQITYGFFNDAGVFQQAPGNVGGVFEFAARGEFPSGQTQKVTVEVVDHMNRKAIAAVEIDSVMRNHRIRLTPGNPDVVNIHPQFENNKIAFINIVMDRENTGSSGRIIFQTHGLSFVPEATHAPYNRDSLTNLTTFPGILSRPGSSLGVADPGTRVNLDQTSSSAVDVDYNLAREQDFALVEIADGFFNDNDEFEGRTQNVGDVLEIAGQMRGVPTGITKPVKVEVFDHKKRKATFTVSLDSTLKNYRINLTGADNVPVDFENDKIAVINIVADYRDTGVSGNFHIEINGLYFVPQVAPDATNPAITPLLPLADGTQPVLTSFDSSGNDQFTNLQIDSSTRARLALNLTDENGFAGVFVNYDNLDVGKAYRLQEQYGFEFTGSSTHAFNWSATPAGGQISRREKWLIGNGNQYYILPNGEIYIWQGTGNPVSLTEDTLIGQVHPRYYHNLNLLVNPTLQGLQSVNLEEDYPDGIVLDIKNNATSLRSVILEIADATSPRPARVELTQVGDQNGRYRVSLEDIRNIDRTRVTSFTLIVEGQHIGQEMIVEWGPFSNTSERTPAAGNPDVTRLPSGLDGQRLTLTGFANTDGSVVDVQMHSQARATLNISLPNEDSFGGAFVSYDQFDVARVYKLNQEFEFAFSGSPTHFEGWSGSLRGIEPGEKWITNQRRDAWYYILDDGRIFKWRRSGVIEPERDELIAQVHPRYYEDPSLIYNATLENAGSVNFGQLFPNGMVVGLRGITGNVDKVTLEVTTIESVQPYKIDLIQVGIGQNRWRVEASDLTSESLNRVTSFALVISGQHPNAQIEVDWGLFHYIPRVEPGSTRELTPLPPTAEGKRPVLTAFESQDGESVVTVDVHSETGAAIDLNLANERSFGGVFVNYDSLDIAKAFKTQNKYQFLHSFNGRYFQNWSAEHAPDGIGLEEKWLRRRVGNETEWFYILPNGGLYKWNTERPVTPANDQLVEKLHPRYYQDPALLIDATLDGVEAINFNEVFPSGIVVGLGTASQSLTSVTMEVTTASDERPSKVELVNLNDGTGRWHVALDQFLDVNITQVTGIALVVTGTQPGVVLNLEWGGFHYTPRVTPTSASTPVTPLPPIAHNVRPVLTSFASPDGQSHVTLDLESAQEATLTLNLANTDSFGGAFVNYDSLDIAAAYKIKNTHGLRYSGSHIHFESWSATDNGGGIDRGEKWFRTNTDNVWYYILPNGNLYLWKGRSNPVSPENDTFIRKLHTRYHEDPSLLYGATLDGVGTMNFASEFPSGMVIGLGRTGARLEKVTLEVTTVDSDEPARIDLVQLGDGSGRWRVHASQILDVDATQVTTLALIVEGQLAGEQLHIEWGDFLFVPKIQPDPSHPELTELPLLENGQRPRLTAFASSDGASEASLEMHSNQSSTVRLNLVNEDSFGGAFVNYDTLGVVDAFRIKNRFQLEFSGNVTHFENWSASETGGGLGFGEKWVRNDFVAGESTRWFYILPNGNFYEWTGLNSEGQLDPSGDIFIGQLHQRYHQDPSLLYNATLQDAGYADFQRTLSSGMVVGLGRDGESVDSVFMEVNTLHRTSPARVELVQVGDGSGRWRVLPGQFQDADMRFVTSVALVITGQHQNVALNLEWGKFVFTPDLHGTSFDPNRLTDLQNDPEKNDPTINGEKGTVGTQANGTLGVTQLNTSDVRLDYVIPSKDDFVYLRVGSAYLDEDSGEFIGDLMSFPNGLTFALQGPEGGRLMFEATDSNGNVANIPLSLTGTLQNFDLSFEPSDYVDPGFDARNIAFFNLVFTHENMGAQGTVNFVTNGLLHIPVSDGEPFDASQHTVLTGEPELGATTATSGDSADGMIALDQRNGNEFTATTSLEDENDFVFVTITGELQDLSATNELVLGLEGSVGGSVRVEVYSEDILKPMVFTVNFGDGSPRNHRLSLTGDSLPDGFDTSKIEGIVIAGDLEGLGAQAEFTVYTNGLAYRPASTTGAFDASAHTTFTGEPEAAGTSGTVGESADGTIQLTQPSPEQIDVDVTFADADDFVFFSIIGEQQDFSATNELVVGAQGPAGGSVRVEVYSEGVTQAADFVLNFGDGTLQNHTFSLVGDALPAGFDASKITEVVIAGDRRGLGDSANFTIYVNGLAYRPDSATSAFDASAHTAFTGEPEAAGTSATVGASADGTIELSQLSPEQIDVDVTFADADDFVFFSIIGEQQDFSATNELVVGAQGPAGGRVRVEVYSEGVTQAADFVLNFGDGTLQNHTFSLVGDALPAGFDASKITEVVIAGDRRGLGDSANFTIYVNGLAYRPESTTGAFDASAHTTFTGEPEAAGTSGTVGESADGTIQLTQPSPEQIDVDVTFADQDDFVFFSIIGETQDFSATNELVLGAQGPAGGRVRVEVYSEGVTQAADFVLNFGDGTLQNHTFSLVGDALPAGFDTSKITSVVIAGDRRGLGDSANFTIYVNGLAYRPESTTGAFDASAHTTFAGEPEAAGTSGTVGESADGTIQLTQPSPEQIDVDVTFADADDFVFFSIIGETQDFSATNELVLGAQGPAGGRVRVEVYSEGVTQAADFVLNFGDGTLQNHTFSLVGDALPAGFDASKITEVVIAGDRRGLGDSANFTIYVNGLAYRPESTTGAFDASAHTTFTGEPEAAGTSGTVGESADGTIQLTQPSPEQIDVDVTFADQDDFVFFSIIGETQDFSATNELVLGAQGPVGGRVRVEVYSEGVTQAADFVLNFGDGTLQNHTFSLVGDALPAGFDTSKITSVVIAGDRRGLGDSANFTIYVNGLAYRPESTTGAFDASAHTTFTGEPEAAGTSGTVGESADGTIQLTQPSPEQIDVDVTFADQDDFVFFSIIGETQDFSATNELVLGAQGPVGGRVRVEVYSEGVTQAADFVLNFGDGTLQNHTFSLVGDALPAGFDTSKITSVVIAGDRRGLGDSANFTIYVNGLAYRPESTTGAFDASAHTTFAGEPEAAGTSGTVGESADGTIQLTQPSPEQIDVDVTFADADDFVFFSIIGETQDFSATNELVLGAQGPVGGRVRVEVYSEGVTQAADFVLNFGDGTAQNHTFSLVGDALPAGFDASKITEVVIAGDRRGLGDSANFTIYVNGLAYRPDSTTGAFDASAHTTFTGEPEAAGTSGTVGESADGTIQLTQPSPEQIDVDVTFADQDDFVFFSIIGETQDFSATNELVLGAQGPVGGRVRVEVYSEGVTQAADFVLNFGDGTLQNHTFSLVGDALPAGFDASKITEVVIAGDRRGLGDSANFTIYVNGLAYRPASTTGAFDASAHTTFTGEPEAAGTSGTVGESADGTIQLTQPSPEQIDVDVTFADQDDFVFFSIIGETQDFSATNELVLGAQGPVGGRVRVEVYSEGVTQAADFVLNFGDGTLQNHTFSLVGDALPAGFDTSKITSVVIAGDRRGLGDSANFMIYVNGLAYRPASTTGAFDASAHTTFAGEPEAAGTSGTVGESADGTIQLTQPSPEQIDVDVTFADADDFVFFSIIGETQDFSATNELVLGAQGPAGGRVRVEVYSEGVTQAADFVLNFGDGTLQNHTFSLVGDALPAGFDASKITEVVIAGDRRGLGDSANFTIYVNGLAYRPESTTGAFDASAHTTFTGEPEVGETSATTGASADGSIVVTQPSPEELDVAVTFADADDFVFFSIIGETQDFSATNELVLGAQGPAGGRVRVEVYSEGVTQAADFVLNFGDGTAQNHTFSLVGDALPAGFDTSKITSVVIAADRRGLGDSASFKIYANGLAYRPSSASSAFDASAHTTFTGEPEVGETSATTGASADGSIVVTQPSPEELDVAVTFADADDFVFFSIIGETQDFSATNELVLGAQGPAGGRVRVEVYSEGVTQAADFVLNFGDGTAQNHTFSLVGDALPAGFDTSKITSVVIAADRRGLGDSASFKIYANGLAYRPSSASSAFDASAHTTFTGEPEVGETSATTGASADGSIVVSQPSPEELDVAVTFADADDFVFFSIIGETQDFSATNELVLGAQGPAGGRVRVEVYSEGVTQAADFVLNFGDGTAQNHTFSLVGDALPAGFDTSKITGVVIAADRRGLGDSASFKIYANGLAYRPSSASSAFDASAHTTFTGEPEVGETSATTGASADGSIVVSQPSPEELDVAVTFADADDFVFFSIIGETQDFSATNELVLGAQGPAGGRVRVEVYSEGVTQAADFVLNFGDGTAQNHTFSLVGDALPAGFDTSKITSVVIAADRRGLGDSASFKIYANGLAYRPSSASSAFDASAHTTFTGEPEVGETSATTGASADGSIVVSQPSPEELDVAVTFADADDFVFFSIIGETQDFSATNELVLGAQGPAGGRVRVEVYSEGVTQAADFVLNFGDGTAQNHTFSLVGDALPAGFDTSKITGVVIAADRRGLGDSASFKIYANGLAYRPDSAVTDFNAVEHTVLTGEPNLSGVATSVGGDSNGDVSITQPSPREFTTSMMFVDDDDFAFVVIDGATQDLSATRELVLGAQGPAGGSVKVEVYSATSTKPADFIMHFGDGSAKNHTFSLTGNAIPAGFDVSQVEGIVISGDKRSLGSNAEFTIYTEGLSFRPISEGTPLDASAVTHLQGSPGLGGATSTTGASADGTLTINQFNTREFDINYTLADADDFFFVAIDGVDQNFSVDNTFEFAANGPVGGRLLVEVYDTVNTTPADFWITFDGTAENHELQLTGDNIPAGFLVDSIDRVVFAGDLNNLGAAGNISILTSGLDYTQTVTASAYNQAAVTQIDHNPLIGLESISVGGTADGLASYLGATRNEQIFEYILADSDDVVYSQLAWGYIDEDGVFQGGPAQDLSDGWTIAASGPAGAVVEIQLFDTDGDVGKFSISLSESRENFTMTMVGDHLSSEFDADSIAFANFVVTLENSGTHGVVTLETPGIGGFRSEVRIAAAETTADYFTSYGASQEAIETIAMIMAQRIISEDHRHSKYYDSLLAKVVRELAEQGDAVDLAELQADINARVASIKAFIAQGKLAINPANATVFLSTHGNLQKRVGLVKVAASFLAELTPFNNRGKPEQRIVFMGANASSVKRALHQRDSGLEPSVASRFSKLASFMEPHHSLSDRLNREIRSGRAVAASLKTNELSLIDQVMEQILKASESSDGTTRGMSLIDRAEAYAVRTLMLGDLTTRLKINADTLEEDLTLTHIKIWIREYFEANGLDIQLGPNQSIEFYVSHVAGLLKKLRLSEAVAVYA